MSTYETRWVIFLFLPPVLSVIAALMLKGWIQTTLGSNPGPFQSNLSKYGFFYFLLLGYACMIAAMIHVHHYPWENRP